MDREQGNKTMIVKNGLNNLILFLLLISGMGCSESESPTTADHNEAMDLDTLRHAAEQARLDANTMGFEWRTIQPLLDQANEAITEGNKDQAKDLFILAKEHAELAIEQAKYADEHWQLLVPNIN